MTNPTRLATRTPAIPSSTTRPYRRAFPILPSILLAILAAAPLTADAGDTRVAAEVGRDAVAATMPSGPPASRRDPVIDTYHGDEVIDPYRWLETLDDPETLEWARRQDAYARARLEAVPGRDAIRTRYDAIEVNETTSVPKVRGVRTFYQVARRHSDGSIERQLLVEEAGAARVLVDLEAFPAASRFGNYPGSRTPTFQPSPNGRHVAFGVLVGSSRWTVWHVLHVDTGRYGETITGIHTDATAAVSWSPDSRGFFYAAHREQVGQEEVPLRGQAIFYHRLGDDTEDDRLIYQETDTDSVFTLSVTTDGRYLALVNMAGNDQDLLLVDLDDPAARPRRLLDGDGDQHSLIDRVGERLWVRTTRGADQGRVAAIRPTGGELETIVPERSWGALVSARLVGEHLLVHRVEHAAPRLELYDLAGNFERQIELPYIGWLSSGLLGTRQSAIAAFELQGTADVGSTYLLDVESGKTRPFRRATMAFDPTPYATRQVFYPSHDGTLIPLFLIYRKGLRLDSSNPVWLYAYGSRWSAAPWYQPQHRLWLELGGVYALANVRGGGEYGDSWIEAGSGVNKQTGIEDYVAAAAWLIESGYTSADHLVANGGSASGPLVAAAVNQHPELFRAALIDYPLIDMLRAPQFRSTMTAGFDTPKDPDAYRALRAWSPYHNIANGTCYPATLIAHGNEDRTASPLHSYKLTAGLQAAQGCDRPILLQVAWGRGHTVGGSTERVNQLAFLVAELGLRIPEDWGTESE